MGVLSEVIEWDAVVENCVDELMISYKLEVSTAVFISSVLLLSIIP